MKTFLEYFKGNKILNPKFQNGKDPFIDTSERKHANIKPKQYKHKLNIVDRIVNGNANNIVVKNNRLQNILDEYSIDFAEDSKTLGNSKVMIKMYIDDKNNRCGLLTRK